MPNHATTHAPSKLNMLSAMLILNNVKNVTKDLQDATLPLIAQPYVENHMPSATQEVVNAHHAHQLTKTAPKLLRSALKSANQWLSPSATRLLVNAKHARKVLDVSQVLPVTRPAARDQLTILTTAHGTPPLHSACKPHHQREP